MDKYIVKLYTHAVRDLDEIYSYIAERLKEPDTANNLIGALEEAILSLESFPERGSFRKSGAYRGKLYRQLFVKNYCIVYKVDKLSKTVMIVTVRNVLSDF